MKFIKKIVSTILGSIMMFAPMTVYATETNEENSEVGNVVIEVHYSNDIAPEYGDEFEIVYSVKGDEQNYMTKTVDTAMAYTGESTWELPCNIYSILDITYKGNEEKIKLQGYATVKEFYSTDLGDSYLPIYIGTTSINRMKLEYQESGIKIMDANHSEYGEPYKENDVLDQDIPKDETLTQEPVSTLEEQVEQVEQPEQTEPEENVITDKGDGKVEYYNNEKEDEPSEEDKKEERRKDAIQKLILLIGFAAISLGIMFVLHKNGRI